MTRSGGNRRAGDQVKRRYIYWLTDEELDALRRWMLEEKRKRITPVRGVPCKGFNELLDVSYVAPEEWDKVCRRQGGWYRESPRRGQYLVLSAEPLPVAEHRLEAVVEPADFVPPRLPGAEEVAALARGEVATSRMPEGWNDITDRDRAYWRRLLARVGSDMTLDDIMTYHTANHANFIEPRFFTEAPPAHAPIPYSIGRTAEVCSACVELSNILGAAFPVKYVMPCPGFVLFTKLPADTYLRVSTPAAGTAFRHTGGE